MDDGLLDKLRKEYTGKRILVTGGAGYLGASLVNLLSHVCCYIVRLGRPGTTFTSTKGAAQICDEIRDIRQRETWELLLRNIDVVFHLAAQTSTYVANENPLADQEINALPMLHLLETCWRNQWEPVVVFAGTVTEAGVPTRLPVDETHPDRPVTVYDLHKLMADAYLRHYSREGVIRGVVLRLANVYGPGPVSRSSDRGILNRMIRRALAGEQLTIYGSGDHLRDYVFIEDVSVAFLDSVLHIDRLNGQYFIIGSGQGHSLKEAVSLVAERVKLKVGWQVPVVHIEPPMPRSPIEARNFVADPRRFTEATGWQPRYSLTEGIDRTIEAVLCGS